MLKSLTQRQLLVFAGVLSVLAVAVGTGGALLINKFAEETSDRVLEASAHEIADNLGVEKGAVTFEMPPAALGMLEDSARDNIYYSISLGGRVLSGYPSFPAAPKTEGAGESTKFRYDKFFGQPVRVVTVIRRLPRLSQPAVVQIAETLDQRRELAMYMLLALAALELVLIVTAFLTTRPAVSWGLKPLARVQDEIRGRGGGGKRSLKPLDVALVPQELAGLVEAFNDLLQRLSRSIEQTRRFTADASHQMRTPLAILRTHLDVVTTQVRSRPEVARSFDDIRAATDRLQRLLTQLLSLARAEEASTPGQTPACDVNDVAAEACREFAPLASEAGLEIHLDQTHAVVTPLEPILLREILLNLFDNSVKYHEIGTHIQVQVGFDSEPFLAVSDDGRGIPPALLPEATARFSRLARDNQKPGSGLGLPIVAAICESYGATLALESSEDLPGLRARIGFPLGTASPLE